MGVGQWSPKANGEVAERLHAPREGAGF